MARDQDGGGLPVEADLATMVQLMGRMAHGFKRGRGEVVEVMEQVREAGLGPRHVPVLFALVMYGPVPVGVLARHVALSPATVSQLVGELQRGGFVERSPDERDRRRMIVSLGPDRRDLVERFAQARIRPIRMTLEALSPVERAHFLLGWRTMVEMIERADPGGSGFGPCGPADEADTADEADRAGGPDG